MGQASLRTEAHTRPEASEPPSQGTAHSTADSDQEQSLETGARQGSPLPAGGVYEESGSMRRDAGEDSHPVISVPGGRLTGVTREEWGDPAPGWMRRLPSQHTPPASQGAERRECVSINARKSCRSSQGNSPSEPQHRHGAQEAIGRLGHQDLLPGREACTVRDLSTLPGTHTHTQRLHV